MLYGSSFFRYHSRMQSVLIPVFSDEDLQALRNCLRFLASLPDVERVLVLHGPNIGVVNADATKEIDAKIAQKDTHKRELVAVEDFEGAKRIKGEIEALRVDRDMKIRDGWKNVPEDKRAAAYAKAFAGIGTEPVCLREAYQPDQLFTMLQAFLPQWPSDIAHGEYAIIWPRSITQHKIDQFPKPKDNPHSPQVKKTAGRSEREQELKSMHHVAAIQVAKKAGIEVKGKKVVDIISELLDKEFPRELAVA